MASKNVWLLQMAEKFWLVAENEGVRNWQFLMKGKDRFGLTKKEIIRGKRTFDTLFQEGRRYRTPYFNFIYAENKLSYNRIAPIVSKRHGDSVFRNHTRRVIKEIYRGGKFQFRTGFDISIILNNRQFCERTFPEKRDIVIAGLSRLLVSKKW